MHLDLEDPIGSKYASTADLREAIVTISKHTPDRKAEGQWARNVRFLTPIENVALLESWSSCRDQELAQRERPQTQNDENLDGPACSCSPYQWVFVPSDRSILLTQPPDFPDCTHYLAVSYCWQSSEKSAYATTNDGDEVVPFSILEPGRASRTPMCPPSLLARCTAYAASKGLSFIWIDQECIIQDDPEDKALAIQAMDEVYDQAEECVAVLEVCFEEQRHLDAIEILIENNSNRLCNEDGTRDVCEALRLILSDRWFERAWCLQESTAGGTQMALLIRSDPRLTIPDCFRSEVYGCFEIQLSWLHTVIGCLEWFDAPDAEPLGADTAELARTVAGMWYDCMPQESDEERGAVSFGGRTICDAAEALYYLDRRHNSVIADRLDILANMCGYEVRLDVLALDAQGFDFSICAVVLAILNGDFSINHGCADLAATGVGGRKFVSWHQPLGHTTAPDAHELPFTWWSLLASSLQSIPLYNWYYKDPPGRNFRYSVRAGISLKRGLEIEGCLFVADKTIDVSDMVTGLLERWKERLTVSLPKRGILAIADAASRDSEFGEARHIFFIRLFCRLVEQGYDRLAQLLWKLGRSPATYRERSDPQFVRWYEADAADVLDVPGRQVKWPKPESSPTVNRSGTRSHTSPFATSWTMTMVLCQALIHGKLVVARPGSSRRQASSYSALFQDQYVDANYLAAKTNGKPISLHSHLGWYPSEWRVQVHSGTHAQIEQVSPIVASCLASVCGLWEADDEYMEPVAIQ